MRKKIAVLLIIAAALTVLGGLIFTVGVVAMGNGNGAFIDAKYQNKTYESTDKINSITINTNTADIKILPYDKEGYRVECFENKKVYHSVTVKDGALCIERQDERKWYDHISIFSKNTGITVYVPAGEYDSLSVKSDTGNTTVSKNFTFDKADISCSTGDVEFYASTKNSLTVKTSTGDIDVENTTHGDLSLTVSTGEIEISRVQCKNAKIAVSTGKTEIEGLTCNDFTSTGNTGKITMDDLVAEGSVKITRSTGDVRLNRCDAASLDITTDTGDVKGSLLSDKIFIYKTDTGKVSLPQTTKGGTCKITTDTGDINIMISK